MAPIDRMFAVLALAALAGPAFGHEPRVLTDADYARAERFLAHHANPFSDGNGQPDGTEYSGKAAIEREIVEEEVA